MAMRFKPSPHLPRRTQAARTHRHPQAQEGLLWRVLYYNVSSLTRGPPASWSAPRAAVDDPDVLFGARESRKAHGLDDLTAEESRLAYTDKELYAAGQRIAKDVPHMLNVVNDALTSDRALPLEDTFALTVFLRNQMDALADVHAKMQNGNAASFKAEEEYLSAIVEKASKAVARNNTKLAVLRVARLGVMLDTARDTEAWLTQEVRTRRAAQGLPPEPSESDKAMIKRMAEQLKKANEENESLRKLFAQELVRYIGGMSAAAMFFYGRKQSLQAKVGRRLRGKPYVGLMFPTATSGEGRVYDYVVEASADGRKLATSKLPTESAPFPPGFIQIGEACLFCREELVADKDIDIFITPRNCYGVSGRPLKTVIRLGT